MASGDAVCADLLENWNNEKFSDYFAQLNPIYLIVAWFMFGTVFIQTVLTLKRNNKIYSCPTVLQIGRAHV